MILALVTFAARRWRAIRLGRRAGGVAALAALVLGVVLAGTRARAQEMVAGEVVARDEKQFGRLIFGFPAPLGVSARVAGSVMIVSFDRPVRLNEARLASALPAYVGAVRVDPDFRSMRFALIQPVRLDVKDAAEQVFVDLMPASWRGPPPPLPADVVADLARRAREARGKVDAATADGQGAAARVWPLRVVISETPARLRLAFVLPPGARARLEQEGNTAQVHFNGSLRLDKGALAAALSGHVEAVRVIPSDSGGTVAFSTPGAAGIESAGDDDVFHVDVLRLVASPPAQLLVPAPAEPPVAPRQADAAAPPPAADNPPALLAPATVTARMVAMGEGLRLDLAPRVPLAVFERGGAVLVVLNGTARVELPARDAVQDALVETLALEQRDGWALLRLVPRRAGLVSVSGTEEGWHVDVQNGIAARTEVLRFERATDARGRPHLEALAQQPFDPLTLEAGPEGGALKVFTLAGPPQAMVRPQSFAEFNLLRTAHGVVVEPRIDDLVASSGLDRLRIGSERGLALSAAGGVAAAQAQMEQGLLVDARVWNDDRRGAIRDTERALLAEAAGAGRHGRAAARRRLAGFYLANGKANEAAGVLAVAEADDAVLAKDRGHALFKAIAEFLRHRHAEAATALAHPALASDGEGDLWRAMIAAAQHRFGPALGELRKALPLIAVYPDSLQAIIRPAMIEAALEAGDLYFANQQLGEFERLDADVRDPARILLLAGRIADAGGAKKEAESLYAAAAATRDRAIEAEARLRAVLLGLATKAVATDKAMAELETLAMIWRRGEVELQARARLAELLAEAGQWREYFLQGVRAAEILPEHPTTIAMHKEAARHFTALFAGGKADGLDKVKALALFEEFRHLIPPGSEGDEVAIRTAERLYDLDLIDQASALLEHQVRHRLKGEARLAAASRLALMHLTNGKPNEALGVLRQTRAAAMSAVARRARLLLEARAQSELSRGDLALDILAGEPGADIERLRADIHWRARRWQVAGEAYERALGQRWQDGEALTAGERADLIRAGIAFVLAQDMLGLDRLRSKFLTKMSASEDAATFKLITLDSARRPEAFRDLARSATSAETLSAFIEAYKARYPALPAQPAEKPAAGG